jgi:hypothetical protein
VIIVGALSWAIALVRQSANTNPQRSEDKNQSDVLECRDVEHEERVPLLPLLETCKQLRIAVVEFEFIEFSTLIKI